VIRAIERIVAERPAKVLLSLDNDGPGKAAAAEIAAACEAAGIRVETAWPMAGEQAKDPCAALAQVSFMNTKNGVLTAPER
jgi:DNA primase